VRVGGALGSCSGKRGISLSDVDGRLGTYPVSTVSKCSWYVPDHILATYLIPCVESDMVFPGRPISDFACHVENLHLNLEDCPVATVLNPNAPLLDYFPDTPS
jgi:hypothetical protein